MFSNNIEGVFRQATMHTGLNAIISNLQRNEHLSEQTAHLLMLFGKHNPAELFTDYMLTIAGSWSDYA